jgi:hypothetical protein
MPEEGWRISESTNTDEWHALKPGAYRIVVEMSKLPPQRIHLSPGDVLLANIVRDTQNRQRLFFRRGLYDAADSDTKIVLEQKQDGFLRVHQSHFVAEQDKKNTLEMMLTLENRKSTPTAEGTLQQSMPKRVWLEVEPYDNASTAIQVRWGELFGYPASAWAIDVVNWPTQPKPARRVIKAWWNWTDANAGYRLGSIKAKSMDYRTAFKEERIVDPGIDEKFVIESVSVEIRQVETRPGFREDKSCLVVEARYPTDRPILVEPEGLRVAGYEHHLFKAANKYTGIFWTINESNANGITAMRLFSVDEFKNAPGTERVGDGKPEDPQGNSVRPRTVPELSGHQ